MSSLIINWGNGSENRDKPSGVDLKVIHVNTVASSQILTFYYPVVFHGGHVQFLDSSSSLGPN